MIFAWSLSNVMNAAGGLVVVAFGVLVLALGARGPAARAFALFAVGFGGGAGVRNLGDMALSSPRVAFGCYMAAALLWIVAAVAVVWLGFVFPRRLGRGERRALVLPAVAFLAGLPLLPPFFVVASERFGQGELAASAFMFYVAVTGIAFQAMLGLLILLPLRVRVVAPEERSQLVLLAAALIPYVGYSAGLIVFDANVMMIGIAWAILLAGVVVAWLVESASDRMPRASRNVALLAPLFLLYGMVEAGFFGVSTQTSSISGTSGILRIVAVAVLAYAIVRHRLLGIDVKLRWTISKSTIAAVFIGVFFVASEAAQQFFGETLGSAYVGIAAAGMLVFALSPLQRAAERLAVKAVPIANPTPAQSVAPPSADNEAVYLNALRVALRDKRLSRAEEAHLHRLAEALGIRPGRAHDMLAEVEADLAIHGS